MYIFNAPWTAETKKIIIQSHCVVFLWIYWVVAFFIHLLVNYLAISILRMKNWLLKLVVSFFLWFIPLKMMLHSKVVYVIRIILRRYSALLSHWQIETRTNWVAFVLRNWVTFQLYRSCVSWIVNCEVKSIEFGIYLFVHFAYLLPITL